MNANDSKLLDTQNLDKLQISGDAIRLLTGIVPAATVVRRQKELLREELALRGKGEKTGKQNFITWFAAIGKGLYREYRVNADMINFPGGMQAYGEPVDRHSELRCNLKMSIFLFSVMIIVFIRKRMVEVPHFKTHYEFLMIQLDEERIVLFAAMFASPYNMLCRFEQDNFASDYEWWNMRSYHIYHNFIGGLNQSHWMSSNHLKASLVWYLAKSVTRILSMMIPRGVKRKWGWSTQKLTRFGSFSMSWRQV